MVAAELEAIIANTNSTTLTQGELTKYTPRKKQEARENMIRIVRSILRCKHS